MYLISVFKIVTGEGFYPVGDIHDLLLFLEPLYLCLLGLDEVQHLFILRGMGLEQCGHSFVMRYPRLHLLYNMVKLLLIHGLAQISSAIWFMATHSGRVTWRLEGSYSHGERMRT